MLCVLLVGSIDISTTAVLAFAGAVAGKLMGLGIIQNTFLMFALGTLFGFADSAVNLSVGVILILSVLIPNLIEDWRNAQKVAQRRKAIRN